MTKVSDKLVHTAARSRFQFVKLILYSPRLRKLYIARARVCVYVLNHILYVTFWSPLSAVVTDDQDTAVSA